MLYLKAFTLVVLTFVVSACTPPAFVSPIAEIALQGQNVPIRLKVVNDPSSVTCFSGSVTLLHDTGDYYSGSVDQGLLSLNENIVTCRAENDSGALEYPVGTILVVANSMAPSLDGTDAASFDDNDGANTVDIDLIDGGSNLFFETYSLAPSSDVLPVGLNIDRQTGNLVGSADVVGATVLNLVIRVETIVGSADTDTITLTINDA